MSTTKIYYTQRQSAVNPTFLATGSAQVQYQKVVLLTLSRIDRCDCYLGWQNLSMALFLRFIGSDNGDSARVDASPTHILNQWSDCSMAKTACACTSTRSVCVFTKVAFVHCSPRLLSNRPISNQYIQETSNRIWKCPRGDSNCVTRDPRLANLMFWPSRP